MEVTPTQLHSVLRLPVLLIWIRKVPLSSLLIKKIVFKDWICGVWKHCTAAAEKNSSVKLQKLEWRKGWEKLCKWSVSCAWCEFLILVVSILYTSYRNLYLLTCFESERVRWNCKQFTLMQTIYQCYLQKKSSIHKVFLYFTKAYITSHQNSYWYIWNNQRWIGTLQSLILKIPYNSWQFRF